MTAPISGWWPRATSSRATWCEINTPIFTIVDNARLEATLNAPEREIEVLKAGQAVQLAVDALPGKTFEGRPLRFCRWWTAAAAFRVVCAFDGGGELQPGMFGRIRIHYDQRRRAGDPAHRSLDDGSAPAVFTVRGGKAVRTELKLGYIDGEWVEVRTACARAIRWWSPARRRCAKNVRCR